MTKELVIAKADSVEVQDYDGNVKERASYTAELDLSDIGKGTYPYYMLKEIDEQPTVMRKLIQAYTDESGQVVVTQLLSSLLKKQIASISLRLVPLTMLDLRLKNVGRVDRYPVELGISSEGGMVCHF